MKREFTEMPYGIEVLPIDDRGYPVPFFVAYRNGRPDHRIVDEAKKEIAHKEKRCFICGRKLGGYKAFVLFPMNIVTRISDEPPAHYTCAEWAVKNCPHMVNSKARRNDHDSVSKEMLLSETGIENNGMPVQAIWVTKKYKTVTTNTRLFIVGEAERVEWYSSGKPATRDMIEANLLERLPIFEAQALEEGDYAHKQFLDIKKAAWGLLPDA